MKRCDCGSAPMWPAGSRVEDVRVERAAILLDDIMYSLPAPARHCHVLEHMREAHGFERIHHKDEGFVMSNGCWARRKPAYRAAKAQGQLIPREGGYRKGEIAPGPELFSDDLW